MASVEWETRFDRFDRAGDVSAPFLAEQQLVIAPDKRLPRIELGRAVTALRRRLEQAGWEYRLTRRGGRFVLALDRKASPSLLELLLARGRVEIWTATRPADSDTGGMMVGDDASFRVTLGWLVAANGQYEVESEVEPLPEPRLRFALERASPAAGDTLLALVLDGKVLDCTKRAEDGGVVFTGWGNKESATMLAAVASNPAIGARFKVLSSR
jgi:hypothetical protein